MAMVLGFGPLVEELCLDTALANHAMFLSWSITLIKLLTSLDHAQIGFQYLNM